MSETHENSSSEAAVDLLAKGVLELYEPPLVTIKTHLKEITERQESVLAALTADRRRIDDLQSDAIAEAMIANVAVCRDRLVAVSSSMVSLHRRVASLQARAVNIERAAKSRAAKQNSQ